MKIRHYIGEQVQVPPEQLYIKHIAMAKRGELPVNHWKEKCYTTAYMGTWPIDIAKQIAFHLGEHGIKVKIRGRGPRKGRYHDGLPLNLSERGALYLY